MFFFLWYYIIRMKIGCEIMEQKKMSLARFYVPLLIILSLSILILSLSYSKESGNTDYDGSVIKENNLKIVYANGTELKSPVVKLKDYKNATEFYYSITNEGKNNNYYELDIICDDCYGKGFYYSIDGGEPVEITSKVLIEEEFEKYGSLNDHVSHSLRVFSPDKAVNNMKYQVRTINRNTIEYAINKDNSVMIVDGKYVYRDDTISNYVIKDGILYRITDIKNDMISCSAVDENVEIKGITFSKKMDLAFGNGTIESPYEVNYES